LILGAKWLPSVHLIQLFSLAGWLFCIYSVFYTTLLATGRSRDQLRLGAYLATKSSFAQEVIERIAAIYAIEERVRGTNAEIRLAARKNETEPLMAELKMRLTEVLKDISSKSH
jgi:hypothetical protein